MMMIISTASAIMHTETDVSARLIVCLYTGISHTCAPR